jgi:hypothetical protein
MGSKQQQYAITVFGASGVTGMRILEELLVHGDPSLG